MCLTSLCTVVLRDPRLGDERAGLLYFATFIWRGCYSETLLSLETATFCGGGIKGFV